MSWIAMAVVLVLGAALQTAFPPSALLGHAKPPVLLCIVLTYALHHEAGCALLSAAVAGMMQDALSRMPMGYSSLCFCAVAWPLARMRRVLQADALPTWLVFGAGTAVAVAAAQYGLLWLGGQVAGPGAWLGRKLGGVALLGLVSAPLVSAGVRRLDRMAGGRRAREMTYGAGS